MSRIQDHYRSPCDKLVAKKVAIEMYQRDVITLRELESIQRQHDRYKAAEELLKVLVQLPAEATTVLECFLVTLKLTNQQHIVLWIMYPGKIQNTFSNFFG